MNHFFFHFSSPSFKFYMSENFFCFFFFPFCLGSRLCFTAANLPTRRVTVCSWLRVGASGRSGAAARGEMFHPDVRLDRRLRRAAHWCGCHQHAAVFLQGNFNRCEERCRIRSVTPRPGMLFLFGGSCRHVSVVFVGTLKMLVFTSWTWVWLPCIANAKKSFLPNQCCVAPTPSEEGD